MRTIRAQASRLLATYLLIDMWRELIIVAKFGDGEWMPVCLGVRDLVPRWGTGTVDGGI